VLDTNIVLDLWVFDDPATHALRQALGLSASHAPTPAPVDAPHASSPLAPLNAPWLATPVMREELARVLTYPHLAERQTRAGGDATQVLAAYDQAVTWCAPASRAPYSCRDADDQKFIDLAVAQAASATSVVVLLSKDRAVLHLKKRLSRLGVVVSSRWPLA
jgi:predicted nucleic acid-binding protein